MRYVLWSRKRLFLSRKVYDAVIEEVTNGAFLFTLNIKGNEAVLSIAQALEEALKDDPDRKIWKDYEFNRQDIKDLAKAFRAYGDAGTASTAGGNKGAHHAR